MQHELASTGRLALDAERGRIEAAQVALRAAARWQATIAFGIPSMGSCVVLVLTLVNYPGAWYEVLLVSVVQVFALGAIFSLPTLFFGGYSVLTLERRLRRDAAAGWPIERVFGDVTWSRRRHALVAKANGRLLASPFFTALKDIPTYWDHCDQLAPGAYQLEILRESGLVLSAQPLASSHATSIDEQPGNVALRAAFRSSLDDVEANRRGLASGAQRLRLLVANAWLVPALVLVGVATTLAVRGVLGAPHVGTFLGALIAAALALFVTYFAGRVVLDVAQGELKSRAGLVYLTRHKTEDSGTVGGMEFTVSHARARALQIGIRYRVYVFRRSRQMVSAELA